jgi:5-methylcytosine-specific restriction endonuclease McrA
MGRNFRGDYSDDWPAIALAVKQRAGWRCERCREPHDPETGHVLTVHHLDGDKSNNADWNLAALCQRCHLRIQGKVDFSQSYMFEHTPWMHPHVAGYLAERGDGP